jgi:predicted lysophospholipase L1 biosynthesis ABC-type transport system permease subunit
VNPLRTGTILLLLALVLLFAAFGLKVFGWLLLFGLVLVLLGVGAVLVAFWAIKRRLRRNLEQLGRAMAGQHGGPGGTGQPPPGRGGSGDVIDVEPVRKPRDGADAPEE